MRYCSNIPLNVLVESGFGGVLRLVGASSSESLKVKSTTVAFFTGASVAVVVETFTLGFSSGITAITGITSII